MLSKESSQIEQEDGFPLEGGKGEGYNRIDALSLASLTKNSFRNEPAYETIRCSFIRLTD